jgi:hypothetical protein
MSLRLKDEVALSKVCRNHFCAPFVFSFHVRPGLPSDTSISNMFVHRVAGPSRLSMPAKLAPARSRRTRAITVEGLGCFVLVQRHKSGMRHHPNLGTQDPRDRRKKKDLGDHEAMKKQGKQIAKMGKRGQERKPIDASVFPTLGQSDSCIMLQCITQDTYLLYFQMSS